MSTFEIEHAYSETEPYRVPTHGYSPSGEMALYNSLIGSEYASQVDSILKQNECDIEPEFLGFTEIYRKLADIIPVGRVVVDLGCAYAFQGWYFRNHAAYIGVDPALGKHLYFKVNNGRYFPVTIREFMARHSEEWQGRNAFAICNYVPPWYGDDNQRLVREHFEHVFVFYPMRGDRPELEDAEDFCFNRTPTREAIRG